MIIEVPPAAGIVGHGVSAAGNVVVRRDILVGTLMQGSETQEIGVCANGGGRALRSPRNGGPIIAREPNGSFGQVTAGLNQNMFLS